LSRAPSSLRPSIIRNCKQPRAAGGARVSDLHSSGRDEHRENTPRSRAAAFPITTRDPPPRAPQAFAFARTTSLSSNIFFEKQKKKRRRKERRKKGRRTMREKIIFCKPGGGAREEAGEGHPRRCKSTSAYGAISLARGKQDFSSCRKRRGGGAAESRDR
jgi:hypothetical protein